MSGRIVTDLKSERRPEDAFGSDGRRCGVVFRPLFRVFSWILCFVSIFFLVNSPGAQSSRQTEKGALLKNLVRIGDVRSNQLLGYGLVVGLPGTGDTRSPLAAESMKNLLGNLGQKLEGRSNLRNIAAVLVTTEIPAFAKKGDRLDAVVSSIGDARSLQGGVLIQTPLRAGNNQIYAVAQGALTTSAREQNRNIRTGNTVGVIMNGVLVERGVQASYHENRRLSLRLKHFDFTLLNEIKKRIKEELQVEPRVNNGVLEMDIPQGREPLDFIARLESIRVQPVYEARVIINERSGTVVMGGDIRVDPVSISRGGLQLTVKGKSAMERAGINPELQITYGPGAQKGEEGKKGVSREFSGSNVKEIVESLNAMGATVGDIIAILQALKESGALHASLIVN